MEHGKLVIFIIFQKKKTLKKNQSGKIMGYYFDDVYSIKDKYYSWSYDENIRINEFAANAMEYGDGCNLVNFGNFSRCSSVELHIANCTSGFLYQWVLL